MTIPRLKFGPAPWWHVSIPCISGEAGREKYRTFERVLQALDADEACRFARYLVPKGWDLDRDPEAIETTNPYEWE